jgi:hypothetical protein
VPDHHGGLPRRVLLSPEWWYAAALGLSGVAAIGSVALPAAERGQLAAVMVSSTLGASIGGFSIDTFLLSRPAGWVFSRGRPRVLGLLLGSLALSALVAAVLTWFSELGGYPVAMGGAGALTLFNAFASLAMRTKRFLFVYGVRAAGGVALVAGYALLWANHDLAGRDWSHVWLLAQLVAAVVLAAEILVRARRFGKGATREPLPPSALSGDLKAMARLHLGMCAQMLTYRLDQVLLARFAGPGPLGVYALAVAGLEFAQTGAVVAAQRILAEREPVSGPSRVAPILRLAAPIAVVSVCALAVIGIWMPEYHDAWKYGLLLLPGSLAVSMAKAWGANLLKLRGERATTSVALVTLTVAVPCYFVLVPVLGAPGAAIASSFVYVVQAAGLWFGLRPRVAVGAS